jgi:hypothetical protein
VTIHNGPGSRMGNGTDRPIEKIASPFPAVPATTVVIASEGDAAI